MATWDGIYRTLGAIQGEDPSEQIVGIVPILKERGVKRVLDHGCGPAKNTAYLASEGFEVVGMDNSKRGLELAQKRCLAYRNAAFVEAEMDNIPYNSGYFDAVISSHCVQHALAPKRAGAFREFGRVIRSNGLLFLRTISTRHPLFGKGRELDEIGTFVDIPDLPDGNVPHHYFTKDELEESLSANFVIERITHRSDRNTQGGKFPHGLEEWVVLARRK